MCHSKSRREKSNRGQLLLVIVGILLLFRSSQDVFPGCHARVLSVQGNSEIATGHGVGRRSREAFRWLQTVSPPKRVPTPPPAAPKPGPAPAPTPSSGPQNDPPPFSGPPFQPKQFLPPAAATHAPHPAPTTHAPPPAPTAAITTQKKKKTSFKWAYVIGPAAFVFVIGLFAAVKVRLVVRKHKREGGTAWKRGISDSENEELQKTTYGGVPFISLQELEDACEEFTNVIFPAADGTVFKGIRASDGMQIAVTRIQTPATSQAQAASGWTPKKEIAFRRKVEDLARMNHDNLVNLLAYSTSERPFARLLVFEYASNGTLYEHLHGKCMEGDHLDWGMRMRIIMGAAYGLRYMHHELNPPISHFKFDASHVLLTEDYAAKVADFGLSHVAVQTKSLGKRKSFRNFVKAMGYNESDGSRPTRYFESNIRSFGVFLLETITGRPPFTDDQGSLIDWSMDYLYRPEKMEFLVDSSMKGKFKKDELVAVCEVIRMCIPRANKHTGKNPTMRDVADALSKGLKMTPEAANNKVSPLLWAEMQLLDNSTDDEALTNSTRHRHVGSTDSYRGSSHPVWADSPTSPGGGVGAGSPRPKFGKVLSLGGSNQRKAGNGSRFWAENNASEFELLSPPLSRANSDDPEMPLAASINSSMPLRKSSSGSQESIGRSFRRVWAEHADEIDARDLVSPGGRHK